MMPQTAAKKTAAAGGNMLVMPEPDRMVLDRRAEIVAALRNIVPGEGVIDSERERRAYECDALTAYRQAPMVVVLPDDTAQVVAVLRYCKAHGVKVVPRGAGTSLSGGALPLEDGVLLGLGKFKRILEIDVANRCAVVQPGVTNLAISHAVQGQGLSTTRRTRRARSPAPSAAMSRKIPAACIASNTASPPTMSSASNSSPSTAK